MSQAQPFPLPSDYPLTTLAPEQDLDPLASFSDLENEEFFSPVRVNHLRKLRRQAAEDFAHQYWISSLGGSKFLAASVHQHGTLLWLGRRSAWVVDFARGHPNMQVIVMDPNPIYSYTTAKQCTIKHFDGQETPQIASPSLSDEPPNLVNLKYDRKRPLPRADNSTTSVLVEDFYLYEDDLLNEVYRVLSPGGQALFCTPATMWESDCPKFGETCETIAGYKGLPDELAPSSLLNTLERVGFDVATSGEFSWPSDGTSKHRVIKASTSILRNRAEVYVPFDFDDELSSLYWALISSEGHLKIHGQYCFTTTPDILSQEKSSLSQVQRISHDAEIDRCSLSSTAWQHITDQDSVSEAWNTLHRSGNLQKASQQLPNEAYVSQPLKEYLFFWSTEIGLEVSSMTLNNLCSRYQKSDLRSAPCLHVMSLNDALTLCLMQAMQHESVAQTQIDSIIAQLQYALKQHLSSISQERIARDRMIPRLRTCYVLAALGILHGKEWLLESSLRKGENSRQVSLPVLLLESDSKPNKSSWSSSIPGLARRHTGFLTK